MKGTPGITKDPSPAEANLLLLRRRLALLLQRHIRDKDGTDYVVKFSALELPVDAKEPPTDMWEHYLLNPMVQARQGRFPADEQLETLLLPAHLAVQQPAAAS